MTRRPNLFILAALLLVAACARSETIEEADASVRAYVAQSDRDEAARRLAGRGATNSGESAPAVPSGTAR